MRSNKEPRSMGGKTRKHHWFKNARVNIRMALDQRRAEAERRRISEMHRTPMFGSIRELFKTK